MASAAGSNVMLEIHEKKTTPTDLYFPLPLYIASAYSEREAAAADDDLNVVHDLRAAVEKPPLPDPSSLEQRRDALLAYARALARVETCFPISPDPAHVDSLTFTWHDAFKGNKKCTLASIHLEKAAVLFNLGAVYSKIALAAYSSNNVRTACDAFQSAAGAFAWLFESGVAAKAVAVGATTVDVRPECAGMLEKLMLAQAQECFVEVIAGGKAPTLEVVQQVAQVAAFYVEAYEALSVAPLNDRTNKSFAPHVELKAAHYHADAYYRYSLYLHEKGELGEEIARLKIGMRALADAKKAARRVAPQLLDSVKKLESNMKANLEKAMKENDSACQQVPAAGSLGDIPADSLVKATSLDEVLDARNESLFTSLVSDEHLKALSKYTEMVDNVIHTQAEKLQQAIRMPINLLMKMELPDSIDLLRDNMKSHSSLKEGLEVVLKNGGTECLKSQLQKLKYSSMVSQKLLVETEKLLQKEANEDAQSSTRSKFIKDRFHLCVANCKKATDSDMLIRRHVDKYDHLMSIFDGRSVDSILSRISKPNMPLDGNEVAIVEGLEESLRQLESLKAQLAGLENIIKEIKRTDDILPKLSATVGSHDDLFKKEIAKYSPTCAEIAEKCLAQEKLLEQIQAQNKQFSAEFSLEDIKASYEKYKEINAAIAKYWEILKNINVGLKFYVTFQEALDKIKQQCSESMTSPGWIELDKLVNIAATLEDPELRLMLNTTSPFDAGCGWKMRVLDDTKVLIDDGAGFVEKTMAEGKKYCEGKIKSKSDELFGPVQKVRMRDPDVTIVIDESCANPFQYKEEELRTVFANHDDPDDLLKEYVGIEDLKSFGRRPVLEGQAKSGKLGRWIHTRMELPGSTDSATLIMRPDNVYTCGFYNERYCSAFCFELTEPIASGGRSKLLPKDYDPRALHWDVKYRKLLGLSEVDGNAEVERRLREMLEDRHFIPRAINVLSSYIPNLSDDSEAQEVLAGLIFILCEMLRMNLRDMNDHLLQKVQNWGGICTKLHIWREGGYTEKAWAEVAVFLKRMGITSPRDAVRLILLVLNRSSEHVKQENKAKTTKKHGAGRTEDGKNLRATNFAQIRKIGEDSKEHATKDSKGPLGRCRAQRKVVEQCTSGQLRTTMDDNAAEGQEVVEQEGAIVDRDVGTDDIAVEDKEKESKLSSGDESRATNDENAMETNEKMVDQEDAIEKHGVMKDVSGVELLEENSIVVVEQGGDATSLPDEGNVVEQYTCDQLRATMDDNTAENQEIGEEEGAIVERVVIEDGIGVEDQEKELEQSAGDESTATKVENGVKDNEMVDRENVIDRQGLIKDGSGVGSLEEDVVTEQGGDDILVEDVGSVVKQCTSDQLRTAMEDNVAECQEVVEQEGAIFEKAETAGGTTVEVQDEEVEQSAGYDSRAIKQSAYYAALEAVDQWTNGGPRTINNDNEENKAVAFGIRVIGSAHILQTTAKLLLSLTIQSIEVLQSARFSATCNFIMDESG